MDPEQALAAGKARKAGRREQKAEKHGR